MSTNNDFTRLLGCNETFAHICHSHGNLNRMCGLTLLTRHSVDEGLLKCALQEFQHMFPQLTSRIKESNNNQYYFAPMECPILPFDTDFECQDMLHEKFNVEKGPLWRVQLITERTMEKANIGFGPELQAIIEDDCSISTRWTHFLRYIQGKVNQAEIDKFDQDERGFRSFILMTFHPAITDMWGSFHLMKQFLIILDTILEQDSSSSSSGLEREPLHSSIETLLPSTDSSFHITDIFPIAQKFVGSYLAPKKRPLEEVIKTQGSEGDFRHTQVLLGCLSEQETSEIIAMMEEDDASLHGVVLAAGLIALSRISQTKSAEYPPRNVVYLRACNQTNLRQYCVSETRHGCLTTYYEDDYIVPPITNRSEFWRYAHEMTVKHNAAKGGRQPLKMLRVYNKIMSMSGQGSFKNMEENETIRSDMTVAVYGDLGVMFRREQSMFQSIDTWNKPLSVTPRNIRLEDVFHVTAAQNMGTPFTHCVHLLHGRLNYSLQYSTYVDQRHALLLRDETVNMLRMAADKEQ